MTKLLGIVTLTEDDIARLEFAHRHPGASQYPKIDRRVRHSGAIRQVSYRRSSAARNK